MFFSKQPKPVHVEIRVTRDENGYVFTSPFPGLNGSGRRLSKLIRELQEIAEILVDGGVVLHFTSQK